MRPFALQISAAALTLAVPLAASPAVRDTGPDAMADTVADHAALDRLVAAFAGAAIGAPGGALAPVDRRLRLRPCTAPPALQWHGAPGRTVAVTCSGPGGWRIFVNLAPLAAPANHPASSRTAATRTAAIKRGDALTVAVIGQGFVIRRSAEALESGVAGDWIAVRTGAQNEPVRARIVEPGLAEIPLRR